jgi:hypothetical protein
VSSAGRFDTRELSDEVGKSWDRLRREWVFVNKDSSKRLRVGDVDISLPSSFDTTGMKKKGANDARKK